jgi:hypothetical protein
VTSLQIQKPINNLTPQQQQQRKQFNDWDHIDSDNKIFLINHDHIMSDPTVYIKQTNTSNYNNDNFKENLSQQTGVRRMCQNEDDLSLSESEDDDDEAQQPKDSTKQDGGLTEININTIQTTVTAPSLPMASLETLLSFKRKKQEKVVVREPKMIEKYFNFYDNLSNSRLIHSCNNIYTIIPGSLSLYLSNKKYINYTKIRLAKTDQCRLAWLKMVLNIDF